MSSSTTTAETIEAPPMAPAKPLTTLKPPKKLKPARKQVKPGQVEKKEDVQTGKEYSEHHASCFTLNKANLQL